MPRPNIVFIMADDMGYGDFGRFGDGRSRTPSLDQLAAEGVCLSQHYSASCVCTPARAGLLTGRYPHRTGALEMRSIRGLDRLSLDEVTVADRFRAAGYRTGLVGKWHTGVYGDAYHPNRRGFDEFIGFRGGAMSYWQWRIERNGTFQDADGAYLTDLLTEEAVGFLQRHRRESFFLCLHYNAPHTPLDVPEAELAPFLEPGVITRGVSAVYAMVHVMDRGIGRVCQALRDLGLEDGTLVLFTSDNGPAMYGHGEECMARFNASMHGGKGNVYEGGIRVPMVLHWPNGNLVGGRTCDAFAHFTDWLPTLLAAAGTEPPSDPTLDGHNILPVLQGEAPAAEPRRFWQWNRYAPVPTCNAAMRDGDWKLVRPLIREAMWTSPEEMEMDRHFEMHPEAFVDILRTPSPPRELPPPPPPELYHLGDDPGETRNLADQHPDRTRRMLDELERWFEDANAGSPWPARPSGVP
ncbi:MAG: sulfatase-like hydrolase/transferase [Lentisphaeria bacterium]|nr:sulfatase-like hydrolase/transferase [Lentisphaeria bacterium]